VIFPKVFKYQEVRTIAILHYMKSISIVNLIKMNSINFSTNPSCSTCKQQAELVCFCSKQLFCVACIGPHLLQVESFPHRPAVLKEDMARLIEFSLMKLAASEKEILEKAEKQQKTKKLISTRLDNEIVSVDHFFNSAVNSISSHFKNLKTLLDLNQGKIVESLKFQCEKTKSSLRTLEDSLETEGFQLNPVIQSLALCADLHEMTQLDLTHKSIESTVQGLEDLLQNSVKFSVTLKTPAKTTCEEAENDENSPDLTILKYNNTESNSGDEGEPFSRLRFSVNTLENPRFSSRYERISYNSPPDKRRSTLVKSSTSLVSKRTLFKDMPKSLIWIDKISECLLSYNIESGETSSAFIPHKSQELEGSVWCFSSDGGLVLTGGYALASRRQTLIVDYVTGTTFAGTPMNVGRFHHAMVRVGNFIYSIAGSNGNPVKDCEKYSTMTDTWQKVGNLNVAREFCSACVHRGRIYVAGGENADSIEAYNTVSNKFSLLRMRLPQLGRTLMASVEDQMVIFQGNKVLHFDSAKMSYVEMKTLEEENWYSPSCVLVQNKLVFFVKKSTVFAFDFNANDLKALVTLT
jgi:hypothetical protein